MRVQHLVIVGGLKVNIVLYSSGVSSERIQVSDRGHWQFKFQRIETKYVKEPINFYS